MKNKKNIVIPIVISIIALTALVIPVLSAAFPYYLYLPIVMAPEPTPTPTQTLTPTATTAPTNPPANCSPAYPGVCIPPPPPDLDCKDIPYRRFQVLPPDPHNFDTDHDGIGCET